MAPSHLTVITLVCPVLIPQDFKASQLGQRRLRLAHKVGLDAKFLTFTKRLTINSALLLPLRTPHAPHKGNSVWGCVCCVVANLS
jgi:hypothetical protein